MPHYSRWTIWRWRKQRRCVQRLRNSTSSRDSEEHSPHVLIDDHVGEQHSSEESPRDCDMNVEDSPMPDDMNSDDELRDFNTFEKFSRSVKFDGTFTVLEIVMMVLKIAKSHNLNWVTIESIFQLLSFLSKDESLSVSKYVVQKFICDRSIIAEHVVCKGCNRAAGNANEPCSFCKEPILGGPSSETFFTLNMGKEIKRFVENKKIQNHLILEPQFAESEIRDIQDGAIYKAMHSDVGELMTYNFNTDGCQSSKSGKLSIWPLYVSINELPPKIRSNHSILIGLWANKNRPNMNLFLAPFIEDANRLTEHGLRWSYRGVTRTTILKPACLCLDSCARSSVLNMTQFNGAFGCTYCEHPGHSVISTKNGRSLRRFTFTNARYRHRTDESIRFQMTSVENSPVKGVKGCSALLNLKGFDMRRSVPVDYMHNVLLGVAKLHTEILLKCPRKPYYIGSSRDRVRMDTRLLSVMSPSTMTRRPRSLNEIRLWKASEWQCWLLMYSQFCLRNVLPKRYYDHWMLLASAIRILSGRAVKAQELDVAVEKLVKYVDQFQKYFGQDKMVYNVHLLLHLGQGVYDWGPLWTHSVFGFENANRLLLNLKQSDYKIGREICVRYLVLSAVDSFQNDFCDLIDQRHFRKTVLTVGETTLFGRMCPNVRQYETIRFSGLLHKEFKIRVSTKSGVYNDCIVVFNDSVFGKVEDVVLHEGVVVLRYRKLLSSSTSMSDRICVLSENVEQREVSEVTAQCVSFKNPDNTIWVSSIPFGTNTN